MFDKPLYFVLLFSLAFGLGIVGEKYAELFVEHQKTKEKLENTQKELILYANKKAENHFKITKAQKEIESEGNIINRFNNLNCHLN